MLKWIRKQLKELMVGLIVVVLVLQFHLFHPMDHFIPLNFNDILGDQIGNEDLKVYLRFIKKYDEDAFDPDGFTKDKWKSATSIRRDPFDIPVKENRQIVKVETGKIRDVPQSTPRVSLKLNGILWDEKAPSAVVNGEIVHVGQRVGSYMVIQIRPQVVILKAGSRKVALRLPADTF